MLSVSQGRAVEEFSVKSCPDVMPSALAFLECDASDEAVARVCGSVRAQKFHEKSAITKGFLSRGSVTSNTLYNQIVDWDPGI
jgi:hypothetical protein